MGKGNRGNRIKTAPMQTERSRKEGAKFKQAQERRDSEILVRYRNRTDKNFAGYSLHTTETVLEFLTRKRW